MELVVCNLQPFVWKGKGKKDHIIHPQDGKLEAFLRPLEKRKFFKEQYEDPSIFPFEEMLVTSATPFVMEADGKKTKELKVLIRLAKNRVTMVVGKSRQF